MFMFFCVVGLCDRGELLYVQYEECKLRPRQGKCCQLGRMRIWLLVWVFRRACALYNACSRVVVRRSSIYAGSAKEASSHAVLVYGSAPKVASFESCDMYSFALKRRVMGLECMALLILKQLQKASYRASGMCHGSSDSSCWFCLCCLCSFRSFV